MLTITDGGSLARALSLPLDTHLKQLLIDRFEQLGGSVHDEVRLVVVQPGDGLAALEKELGFSLFENDGFQFGEPGFSPRWEWIAFDGHTYEMAFEFTCDFTHVLLIQTSPLQNRLLRALCLTYAGQ